MYYVYILRSVTHRSKIYIGYTTNLRRRLREHNSEENKGNYSFRYKPWELECYFAFRNEGAAKDFESYLKGGSGFAFMKKRLLGKFPAKLEKVATKL